MMVRRDGKARRDPFLPPDRQPPYCHRINLREIVET
jgi:hypothetical protein